MNNNNKGE